MKGKIALGFVLVALALIVYLNVQRPSTPPGTSSNSRNSTSTSKAKTGDTAPSFTALSGTVNWPWHPVAKNGSYTITFTASTSNVHSVGLVFTPSPYPNNSNYWWSYSLRVQSNVTYTVAVQNSTYTWTPVQPTVTPLGATFEDDVYLP